MGKSDEGKKNHIFQTGLNLQNVRFLPYSTMWLSDPVSSQLEIIIP